MKRSVSMPFPGVGRRSLYLVWKRECHRSAMTARAFGIPIRYIAPFSGQSTVAKVMRYITSSFCTAWALVRQRPDNVFLLNQPLPLVLIVSLYARLTRARFVLDCHSAPYAWKTGAARSLYAAATRGALANLNHNRADQSAAEAMGGTTFLIPEIPLSLPKPEARPNLHRPNAMVVCSFMADEPLELILAAARLQPKTMFYFSGNWRRRAAELMDVPKNIILLGYLSRESYVAYLATTDAIVTLSVRDHIMQMAAEEALALGRPLVTNRSAILEEVFGDAALFVPLEAQALASAILEAQTNGLELSRRMVERRAVREDLLQRTISAVSHTMR